MDYGKLSNILTINWKHFLLRPEITYLCIFVFPSIKTHQLIKNVHENKTYYMYYLDKTIHMLQTLSGEVKQIN